jgi:predicted phosphoribosyltransferase
MAHSPFRSAKREETMESTLEKRIKIFEDSEAIKKLESRYYFFVDAGIAGDATKIDELIALFNLKSSDPT